ncbi:hypothetical protein GGTG_07858 [Gaeumannomyces tritici R3-111a-1]|uniref:Uncharacterized protein n=1 Tax=Gaeumannomyces tritici (strain R3-111a-1) TaxID=644352 RepID=J3P2W6_GAET3|nr:hypothetical protein GGTG_07858 [Gaeumannomyces tritici R3-111a-1]EJT74008.1 hypothetical protein GGTG_07858 [Gaeumannomyces tritici R3-111a-1]
MWCEIPPYFCVSRKSCMMIFCLPALYPCAAPSRSSCRIWPNLAKQRPQPYCTLQVWGSDRQGSMAAPPGRGGG